MNSIDKYHLPNEQFIKVVTFTTEEDWLELRTKGIGGSDIGAIMMLNKYQTPLGIYKQKVEGYKPDMSDNVYVKKGKDLEDLILKNYVQPYFTKTYGMLVDKPDFMLINDKIPWIRANVDGIAYNAVLEPMIVEIKWVSEHAESNWNGSEFCGVPASYYAQVQLYMAVTGCKKAVVCALFDSSWEVKYFEVPRNEVFIAKLVAESRKFYNNHMLSKIPPLAVYSLDKDDAVEIAKKPHTLTEASAEMTKLIAKHKDISAKIKEAEKFKTKLSDAIFKHWQVGHYPDDNISFVNMATVKRRMFNQNRFKNEHPEMFEEYCEDSEYSKMIIK